MKLVNRWWTKARAVGHSTVMTLHQPICLQWQLKPGDALVTYQLEGILLVMPLDYLRTVGEPQLLQYLQQWQPDETP